MQTTAGGGAAFLNGSGMEATLFRGCLGLLVLLGVGNGLALAQSAPPSTVPVLAIAGPETGSMLPAQNPDPGAKDKEPEKKQTTADKGQQSQSQACQNTQNQNTQNQPTEEEKRAALLRLDHEVPFEAVWFKGGFLLWWIRSAPTAGPLVTTGGVN